MSAEFSIPFEADPASPWPIATRILASHDELALLEANLNDGWTLAFVLRLGEWQRNGRMTLGTCSMPSGDMLKWLLEEHIGYCPTFLITINAEWWGEATEREREILLFHEMLHADQACDKEGTPKYDRITGEPVPTLKAHDLEEFDAVVNRYGAWKSDVASFLASARGAPAREAVPPPVDRVMEPIPEAMF